MATPNERSPDSATDYDRTTAIFGKQPVELPAALRRRKVLTRKYKALFGDAAELDAARIALGMALEAVGAIESGTTNRLVAEQQPPAEVAPPEDPAATLAFGETLSARRLEGAVALVPQLVGRAPKQSSWYGRRRAPQPAVWHEQRQPFCYGFKATYHPGSKPVAPAVFEVNTRPCNAGSKIVTRLYFGDGGIDKVQFDWFPDSFIAPKMPEALAADVPDEFADQFAKLTSRSDDPDEVLAHGFASVKLSDDPDACQFTLLTKTVSHYQEQERAKMRLRRPSATNDTYLYDGTQFTCNTSDHAATYELPPPIGREEFLGWLGLGLHIAQTALPAETPA